MTDDMINLRTLEEKAPNLTDGEFTPTHGARAEESSPRLSAARLSESGRSIPHLTRAAFDLDVSPEVCVFVSQT
jgi:hypothetical protein